MGDGQVNLRTSSPFPSLLDDTSYGVAVLYSVEVLPGCLLQIPSLSSHPRILGVSVVGKLGG